MTELDGPEMRPAGVEDISFIGGPHCGEVWSINVFEVELRPTVTRSHRIGAGIIRTDYGLVWCFCHGFRYGYVCSSERLIPGDPNE